MSVPLALARRAAANYLLHRAYCASFELTYNCNARCQHCHRGKAIPREQLATPQRLLEVCRSIRPIVAIMSGGEPLIRKELEEIVRLFREGIPALRIFVNTNGALLTPRRFQRLKEAGVHEFLISFDFPDERHDEWRAIPGLFGKIESFVGELSPDDRRRVVLTAVVTSRNYRELPRMADVALGWGVNINFSTYTWMRTDDMSLLVPEEEIDELRAVIRRLLEMKAAHGHVLTSDWVLDGMVRFFRREDQGVCRAGERSLVVNPDGTLSPCGLVIRDFPTRKAMLREFTAHNTCTACYTSTRANSERPARHLFLDHIPYLLHRSTA
ncbi:MAG: radical SAM protein [Gemmatimonadetes bacterium]|nr:radical SAM protein [Gemmatimonadota bacterium]